MHKNWCAQQISDETCNDLMLCKVLYFYEWKAFVLTSVVHSDIVYWLFQDTIAEVVGIMWMLFQPLLFGLIGAAVNFDNIKDLNSLGMYMFFICDLCVIIEEVTLNIKFWNI